MTEILSTYSYLGVNLLMLPVVLAGLAVFRRQRRWAMLSGLLLAPFAFASLSYVPRYWDPVRVAEILKTGPEDIVLCFGIGVLTWLMAYGRVDHGAKRMPRLRSLLARYLAFAIAGFIIAFPLDVAGLGPGLAALISITLVGLFLLTRRPDLGRSAVLGGVGFAAFYQVLLMLVLWLWPHFANQWNSESFTGITLLNVPIEETGWALCSGYTWTLLMGWLLVAPLRSAEETPRGPGEQSRQQ